MEVKVNEEITCKRKKLSFFSQQIYFSRGGKHRVVTILMKKPDISVGKPNGSRHSVWEASEIWAVILGDAIFLLFLVCSADLESTLWRVVLPQHQILHFYV